MNQVVTLIANKCTWVLISPELWHVYWNLTIHYQNVTTEHLRLTYTRALGIMWDVVKLQ